jgi:hypothetical protein
MQDTYTTKDKAVLKLHETASFFSTNLPEHPFGVSFLVTVRNCPLIRGALKSIIPYADEIILVDGSDTNSTSNLIKDLPQQKIRYIKDQTPDGGYKHTRHVHQLNLGLNLCCYRWIYKFDGDMILNSAGWLNWRKRLEVLEPQFFYVIDLPCVNPSKKLAFGGYEGRLYTQKKGVKYHWINDADRIKFPIYYRMLRWHEKYVTHLDPK